jgi:GGDEF domain-containing protein
VYSLSNESVTGERASSGGVISLLKMVRAQCAAAVVIAALRGPNGEHLISVSGGPDDVSVGKPARKLVRHLWDGPLEGGDFVTVRGLRLPKGLAPGIGRQAEVAVIPVGATGGDRPDLLCVIGPGGGSFTPEQLDTVGSMAARLASYQEARGAIASSGTAPAPPPTAVPEAPVGQPLDRPAEAAPPAVAGPTTEQAPVGAAPQQTPAGAVPEQAPVGAAPQQPPTTVQQTHPSDVPRGEAAALYADPLGTLFSPDPLTGLSSVPSLLGRLGENLGRLPMVGGTVALVFVRIAPVAGMGGMIPVADAHVNAVADAIQSHVRPEDMVCRLDRRTFGVVTALSPRSCHVSAIEDRLAIASRAALEESAGVLDVLSAHASVDVDHPVGPEALLSRAMSELGDP